MTKEILKALKGSIVKWENIVAGTGVDRGSYDCPLCQTTIYCEGCPVYIKTKIKGCGWSPYEEWYQHTIDRHYKKVNWGGARRIRCPECKRLAENELEFLKGLLPKKR